SLLDTESPLCSARHDGKKHHPTPSSRTSAARCGSQSHTPELLHWIPDLRFAPSGMTAKAPPHTLIPYKRSAMREPEPSNQHNLE
ncbi:hypothetical protein, partial [Pseudovibrio denitrificans]|uniref:hypothetical protein n=1 Tax=Pseudovibrio denitrificans TaxID=258256 RepID=UPI001AD93D28